MKVWIVWDDDYDGSAPFSIHDTEAGARAEAERIAKSLWDAAKAAHEARERTEHGHWLWTYPEQLAPTWVPDAFEPEPFTVLAAAYTPRVEAFEVQRARSHRSLGPSAIRQPSRAAPSVLRGGEPSNRRHLPQEGP